MSSDLPSLDDKGETKVVSVDRHRVLTKGADDHVGHCVSSDLPSLDDEKERLK